MTRERRGVLVIGDTQGFADTIYLLLKLGNEPQSTLRHTTYEGLRSLLNPAMLRKTGLFVVELWREYPTGLRAEGIPVVEQLLRHGAPALVVSPLSIGAQFSTAAYWDLGSTDTLQARCAAWLGGRVSAAIDTDMRFQELKRRFEPYLGPAAEHG